MLITIINIIILIVSLILIKRCLNLNKNKLDVGDNDLLLPVEKNYLYKDINYINRGIVVTLLDLYRKGKIDIEKYVRDSRNKKLADYVIEYKFRLLDRSNLKNHEEIFIENIFKDHLEIDTDQLTQRSVNGDEFFKDQGIWTLAINDELKNKKIIGAGNKKESKFLQAIGLVFLVFGVYSFAKSEVSGLISFISSLALILVAINIGMETSKYGLSLILYFTELEEKAKKGKINEALNENELLELLSICLTMKYFLPIYENSNKYDSINIVTATINTSGGSAFDDAVLRAFMGYTVITRDDTLDTNRIDYRLFK